MPRISVGLSSGLAAAYLRGDHGAPAVGEVRRLLRRGGGSFSSQTPHLRAEDLDRSSEQVVWFTSEVDARVATDLVRRLLDVDGVQAAFVVAPEGPP